VPRRDSTQSEPGLTESVFKVLRRIVRINTILVDEYAKILSSQLADGTIRRKCSPDHALDNETRYLRGNASAICRAIQRNVVKEDNGGKLVIL